MPMELYWSLERFVPLLHPYLTALKANIPPVTRWQPYINQDHNPCEPSWEFMWGCCGGRNGWIACQWSYIDALKGLFHCSIHIWQLWRQTSLLSLADSHTLTRPTTHVNPHGNLCETVVVVEMDGLHANGVILKPWKVCSIAPSIFESFEGKHPSCH